MFKKKSKIHMPLPPTVAMVFPFKIEGQGLKPIPPYVLYFKRFEILWGKCTHVLSCSEVTIFPQWSTARDTDTPCLFIT